MLKTRLILIAAIFAWLLACSLGIPFIPHTGDLAAAQDTPAATEKSPATTTSSTTSPTKLADDVLAVFSVKCVECHSPDALADDAEEARQYITDMTDLSIVRKHVKPGDLKASRLWAAVKPEGGFMPPDSAKEGKLSPEQLEAIKQWILGGAPAPDASAPQAPQ